MQTRADEASMIGIAEYISMLRRHWWLLLLVPLLAAAGAYWITSVRTPTYVASAILLVAPASPSDDGSLGDISGANLLAQTYSELVVSPPVLEQVDARLRLPETVPEITTMVDAEALPDTQAIRISATYHDSRVAADIANTTSESFAVWLAQLRTGINARVILATRAQPPQEPSGLSAELNALLALFLGFALAATGVVVFERTRERGQLPEDVGPQVGLPVLAAVPQSQGDSSVDILAAPRSATSDAIRRLCINLQLAAGGRGVGALAIGGPGTNEGGSLVAANLAVAFAQAGRTVVLVDGNLRSPRQHELFSIESGQGLSNLLVDSDLRLEDVLLTGPVPGLGLLLPGPVLSSPAELVAPGRPMSHSREILIVEDPLELLNAQQIKKIIADIKAVCDVIVIDTPALFSSPDAMLFLASADTAAIVVAAGRTLEDDLQAILTNPDVKSSGVQVLGVVLHGLNREHAANGVVRSPQQAG